MIPSSLFLTKIKFTMISHLQNATATIILNRTNIIVSSHDPSSLLLTKIKMTMIAMERQRMSEPTIAGTSAEPKRKDHWLNTNTQVTLWCIFYISQLPHRCLSSDLHKGIFDFEAFTYFKSKSYFPFTTWWFVRRKSGSGNWSRKWQVWFCERESVQVFDRSSSWRGKWNGQYDVGVSNNCTSIFTSQAWPVIWGSFCAKFWVVTSVWIVHIAPGWNKILTGVEKYHHFPLIPQSHVRIVLLLHWPIALSISAIPTSMIGFLCI